MTPIANNDPELQDRRTSTLNDDKAIERENAINEVVGYFLDQVAGGDEQPIEVVQALLYLRWPHLNFRCLVEDAHLVTLDDFVVDDLTASDLYYRR